MKSTLRPTAAHVHNPESFQLELRNRFQCLEECESVDDRNNKFVASIHEVGSKFFRYQGTARTKTLSNHTLKLMSERNEMRLQSSADMHEYKQVNKQIFKAKRHSHP